MSGVRASEDWLEQFRQDHPDRVSDPNGCKGGGPAQAPGTPRTPDSRQNKRQGSPLDRITLEFTELPPTPNQYARMNRYKRVNLKDEWARLVQSKTRDHIRTPCAVRVLRCTVGRPLDVDGLYGTLKVPLDAMVRAGVLPDDDPSQVARVSAEQEAVGKKEDQRTVITLMHIHEADG